MFSDQFGYQFDFHACAHRQLRHAKCTACVQALIPQDMTEQLAATVGDQVVLGEGGTGIDQAHDFHDSFDTVQITLAGRTQGAQKVDGHAFGRQFACLSVHVGAELTYPGLAVLFGDVTTDENQVAGLHIRQIGSSGDGQGG